MDRSPSKSVSPSLRPGRQRRGPVLPRDAARGRESKDIKLLDQVRHAIRARHYSPRTERCYVRWIIRFIRFNGLRLCFR